MARLIRLCGLMTGGVGLAAALTAAAAPAPSRVQVTDYPGTPYAVSADSASDAWAVGASGNDSPLILHWNGTSWAKSAAPPITAGYPNGVAAISPDDAWAIGDYLPSGGGGAVDNLALHWDGTAWSQAPIPSPGTAPVVDNLRAVSADSATDVWAVGNTGSLKKFGISVLVMHWNGIAWNQVPIPHSSRLGLSELTGVAALSPTDVWAVGDGGRSGSSLILHWNGETWTKVANSLPADLTAVTALSATDVWAVGDTGVTSHGMASVVLHWNGKAWSKVPSPSPGGTSKSSFTTLTGVSALSPTDAWAVGSAGRDTALASVGRPLVLHWNGTAWTQVTSPYAGKSSGLEAVTAISSSDAWAVGAVFQRETFGHNLIVHWNGSTWTRS